MKDDIRQVKQARVGSVELELEHVGNVLEREPIRGRPMSERPFEVVKRKAAVDFRNFVNVLRIVEVREGEPNRLSEDKPNDSNKTDADACQAHAFRNSTAHSLEFDRAMEDSCGRDQFLAQV